MATYGIDYIYKRMTDVVDEYMKEGYWFYCQGMRSSYSHCEARVPLYNGKNFINVYLEDYYINTEDWRCIDYLKLVVEDCENKYTTWNGKGKTLKEEMYYRVSRDKNVAYSDSLKETRNAYDIRSKRSYQKSYYNNKAKEIKFDADKIIKIVNKHYGFKSCKKSQIKKVTRTNAVYGSYYTIYIEGKSKNLTVHFPER